MILEYDLQFFAADGPGGEKTEPATEKKKTDARKEGQVAKSKEIENAFSLMAAFLVLRFYTSVLATRILGMFPLVYDDIPTYIKNYGGRINENDITGLLIQVLGELLITLLPIFLIFFVVSFTCDVAQVKWRPTAKPLQPKGSKLNPISGFKKIFSKNSLIELLKAILKIFIIAWVAYSYIKKNAAGFFLLYDMSLQQGIANTCNLLISMGLRISIAYLIIAFADYAYQKWKFNDDLKMTKQEVKDEWKNAEGDPAVKSKQKQRMQEASRRRMMQAVPSADVVITNPTHFAVAIKYDVNIFDAPYVVAKGEDFLAARIKERAAEAGVEIVENKPLARMLYYNVDLGSPIPPELYQTVAEILAVIYNARQAG